MNSKINCIWNEFSDELYRYIRTRVKNRQDAEDIFQETFVKIYTNIDKLLDKSNLKLWVYRVTKNAIVDYYRKNKEITADVEKFQNDLWMENSLNNMNEEIAKCLEKMIFQLPEKYREIIELHDVKGMKHKEISQKLDISVSCSKMRLKRAKVKLKNILRQCCYLELDNFGNVIDYKHRNNKCEICGNKYE